MKDEENKMQSAAPEQQAQPEQTQPESEPAADAAQPGTENEPKAETTAPETPDKKKRPLWLKLLAVFAAALAVLVLLAVLYINGKLDLIHYDDGTVDGVGTVDAEEDQDLDTTGLTQATNDEMEMPEGSPFADEDVLNILLISTDERTDAVNDWDAFTHLNELDGTKATTEFSSDARADSLILCSLNIKDDTIKLVSIERATGVPILLDGYEGQYDWITHLRRQNRAPASRMVRGGIGFDLAAKTAMVEEQPLPFTRSEYAISEYLALHAGQTFSKEQIYEAVFGYDGTADDTAVTQHIKNIRAKLRTAGVAAPETVLKTIWGVGYQWKSET